jgi:hypothetical protein
MFSGLGHDTGGMTWIWDGTAWTRQHPATSPPRLFAESMAGDAATGGVVMFGGQARIRELSGTWTWGSS